MTTTTKPASGLLGSSSFTSWLRAWSVVLNTSALSQCSPDRWSYYDKNDTNTMIKTRSPLHFYTHRHDHYMYESINNLQIEDFDHKRKTWMSRWRQVQTPPSQESNVNSLTAALHCSSSVPVYRRFSRRDAVVAQNLNSLSAAVHWSSSAHPGNSMNLQLLLLLQCLV